jgi:putative two-component system response regulator
MDRDDASGRSGVIENTVVGHTLVINELIDAPILVVDDEPANLQLVRMILESEGYTNIITNDDPTRVLDLVLHHDCDLILLDLNMPFMDGYEVMNLLSNSLERRMPPVMVLTAQHDQEFRLRALSDGARDYVTKPFDRSELLARVRNLLEVQLLQRYMYNQKDALEYLVAERTREIQETRLQVIRKLGRAAEYRDNETGLHLVRMSRISMILGRASGMNSRQCDMLLDASPMHDIGKIGIPDSILLKPGKLTDDEWQVMKQHPVIGADILAGDQSELLIMARRIALMHHEKWDGSGYPNGLSGTDISIEGRIVAIADVFDALTSERPYKHAWPVSEAVQFIKDNSDKHFDPQLVSLFVDNLNEIVEVIQRYAEPEVVTDQSA